MLYLALILLSPILLAFGLAWLYACAALYSAATRGPEDDGSGPLAPC